MNDIHFSDTFSFRNITFTSYHHTDNRKGAPMSDLAYMKKGHANIVADNQSLQVKEGDVFYIPKNLSYQSYWYGEEEISFISLGFLKLNAKECTKFELQTIPCDEQLVEKIKQIPTTCNQVSCKTLSMFYDVMSEIIPKLKHASESNEEKTVEQIKHCIRQNPHCSLPVIANMCAISEPYLYALFKKIVHMTPNEYKQMVLCNMGIDLLLTTDKKIEEISNILNFSSSSYFRKVLKKHTGTTPREIRKNSGF